MIVKIKNIPVEISFWFAAVITLMILLFPQSRAADCFLLCVLHELGHLVPMLAFGDTPRKIQLGYFGMKIVTGVRLLSPFKEIIIAASGPFVNLTSAAILHCFGCNDTALLSLGLCVFNLLPVPVLDGGRILSQLVKSTNFLRIIGFITAFLLLFFGIGVAVTSKRNFTFIAVSLYLLVGMLTFS